MSRHTLFLVASAREPGHLGNTEWLARRAAERLQGTQTWLRLAELQVPPFVDVRHTGGSYSAPEGDTAGLLAATLAATDIVLVTPVYWYSLPASAKRYLEQWSAWMRVPGLDFSARMAEKTLWLVTTSGVPEKAGPMVESVRLCAEFLQMRWGGALVGKGGAPGTVQADERACEAAEGFLGADRGSPPPG